MFRFIIVLGVVLFPTCPVLAKEPIGIREIVLGDNVDAVKNLFPDIDITPFPNLARCKGEEHEIQDGSTFDALKKDEYYEYYFKMIYVDGDQIVVKQAFTFRAMSVSRELFDARIKEKFDIDEVNEGNKNTIRDALPDYKGITHFIAPEGHFFKITDDDVIRLKYESVAPNELEPSQLTHTITIESRKFDALMKSQGEAGLKQRKAIEDDCGRQELKEIGF